VDIDELAIETSIDRLKSRPALAVPLAAALDDWVSVRRFVSKADVAGWKRLVAVARGIDPDPLRNRLRSAWGQPVIEVRDELRRLAESIDIRAQRPATLLCLVKQLRAAKQLEYAIRLLRDAQYVYPGDFWLKYELGLCLFEQRDFEGMTRFFTAAASIRPNSSPVHDSLGAALGRQKKLVEAITCYRKAIELEPKNAHALRNLGTALADQKKWPEAFDAYHKVIELNPKSKSAAEAYFGIGKAPGNVHDALSSLECIEKAIEIDPTLVEAHNCLAWRLTNGWDLKLRDPQRALEAARKAVELAPDDPFTWKMLGWAHYRAGDWKASVEALEKSCALWSQDDPKGGDAYQWFFLAMAHWRLGEKDKAREWYDRAIEWTDKYRPKNEDLRRFRAEAAELLGLNGKK
jgi:superkiller protein 3